MAKRRFIYDTDTRNLSFIQTAIDLQKLGVEKCFFMLKLYDVSLKGVDPYSPDLTEEQIVRVINECYINPWYYLRECSRIPDPGRPGGVPYQLNRATLAQAWCFLNNIDSYLVIPRQIGKTQSALAILLWVFLFGTTDSEIMFLNMSAEKSVENLTRLKDQRDLLPPYLKFKIAFDDDGNVIKGTDNVRSLSNTNNKNKIITKTSATSIESADKIGRGSTQPAWYVDEFEFIKYIKTIMEAAGPAFINIHKKAIENNASSARIFTSTPGDLDSQPGQDALLIIDKMGIWSEKLYSMPIEEVHEYIELNAENGILYIEYQYTQLGKDEAWLKEVSAKALNNNPIKIKREIFLQRIHGSTESPYEVEDIEAIVDNKGTIKEEIFILRLFKLDVYEVLNPDICYFVGVDVANGYGYKADNSAVTIFNPYTLRPVAEFKSPNIGVKNLIEFLYVLIRKYIPKSILIVERNANGEAVLDHLRTTDVLPNIYFDNSKDMVGSNIDDKLDAHGLLIQEAQRRRWYGVYTHGESRKQMFDLLGGFIKEYKTNFVCGNIISDITKLVMKNGKIQASNGHHDDSIMSFLMCLYVYYYGNNLMRYGFVRGALPAEEDRNKGMNYNEILSYLSEKDREYFNNGYIEEAPQNIHLQSYQPTRGLISEAEMKKTLMGDTRDTTVKKPVILDPYTAKIQREMLEAQKESDSFNKNHNFVTNYTPIDDPMDDTDYVDLSFFTDLNN